MTDKNFLVTKTDQQDGGIGQSVLAGTRSESRRAGKWVRKASDDDW